MDWNSKMDWRCTLADLRLVGRVGGQELSARGYGPYGGRCDPVVGSGAQEDREPGYVLLRQIRYVSERLVFREGWWEV